MIHGLWTGICETIREQKQHWWNFWVKMLRFGTLKLQFYHKNWDFNRAIFVLNLSGLRHRHEWNTQISMLCLHIKFSSMKNNDFWPKETNNRIYFWLHTICMDMDMDTTNAMNWINNKNTEYSRNLFGISCNGIWYYWK